MTGGVLRKGWPGDRAFGLAAGTLAIAAIASLAGNPPPGQPELITEGYASDEACVSCHLRATEEFRQSPMSRSFFRPSSETIFEPFDNIRFYHAPSDRHYAVTTRGDAYVISRYQQDPDGTRYNELSQTVKYVIGGGTHSRTYLYQNPAGELYQLPLAWHAELDGWWMHGGYDRPEHHGFRRPIQRECIGCHSSYPPIAAGADRFGFPHTFPNEMPDGIGCQRCHGPGAEHIRLAESVNSDVEATIASIVNPPRLDRQRAQDVCLQCHLQPASNVSSRNIRFGRGNFEYRPGDVLTDTVFYATMGDEKMQRDRFEANHHPYRLNLSRCAIASGDALTCMTCHDPHHRPTPPDRTAHYRAKCLSCHEEAACEMPHLDRAMLPSRFTDVGLENCVGCHMPSRRAHDLVHEVVTEHRIMRRPPAEDFLAPRGEQPPYAGPASAYPHLEAPPPKELNQHIALIDLKNRIDASQFSALIAESDRTGSPLPSELLMYGAAVQRNARKYAHAVSLLERAIAHDPEAPLLRAELATVLLYSQQLDEADRHIDAALKLHPGLPEAHYARGLVEDRRGDHAAALRALEEAVRLRPQYVEAWNHKATLHLSWRQFDEGIDALENSLRWDPRQPNTVLQCGLALTVAERHEDALRWFQRGRRMSPEAVRFAEGEAMALALNQAARQEIEFVVDEVRAMPQHDESVCLLVMTVLEAREGDRSEAENIFAQAQHQMQGAPSSSVVRQILYDRVREMLGFAPSRSGRGG